MLTGLLTATATGCAVWLMLPPPAPGARRRGIRWRSTVPAALLAGVVGVLTALVEGRILALVLVLAGATAGGGWLVARTRDRRAARQRAERVVEACEALSGELRAGQPPLRALRHCVEVWPELEPVATAGELGADVPRALRRLADSPGGSGLAEVASAWQVSHHSGGTMALALARVADSARRRRATQRLVEAELASAQATARLVAGLPVAVLAMGSGLGGDPWGFLLTTPAGIGCLGTGLALALLGLAWIERIAAAAVDP